MWEASVSPAPHSYFIAQWQHLRECDPNRWKGNASKAFRKQKLLEKERQMEKQNKMSKACGRVARTTMVKKEEHCSPVKMVAYLIDLLAFCFQLWCAMKSSTYIQSTTSLIIPVQQESCLENSKYQSIIQTITKQWLFAFINQSCSLHIYKACFLWRTKKS